MSGTAQFEHPDRIGPYRILQVLGEGGMGIVYEAEQSEPVRRRVAVKMMKVGMDTKEVVGRFEAERQALAVMDHPGIAKVFDAGITEKGRPYFVMELVRGVRLDEYCNQRRLSTTQRIQLFIGICEAVQHAHQKGVIHRDLKPSNILVTEDSGWQPKVIDFGIAKATGERLTRRTVVTTHGQALGTLAYMSPEQAEMSGLDVDTRSDVYSLGVMLYELLLGVVPVDPASVGDPVFVAKLIQRDVPAPKPTQRFSTMDDVRRETVARQRRTDVRRLRRELGSDIQWIILTAMDKDRARRYSTANDLAADLRRYLLNEPVSARQPTAVYRMRKFVSRNRLPVAAGGALSVAVALGLIGTTLGLVRARAAEGEADRQNATATRALDFMIGMFTSSDPFEGGGADVTAREVLDAGIARIDSLDGEPLVQARLLQAMGAVYTTLGLYDDAGSLLRRAVEVNRSSSSQPDTALENSMRQLAWLHWQEGSHLEALPLATDAVTIAEEIYGPESSGFADALQVLGSVERDLGRYDEAREHLQRSLRIREGLFGPDDIQPAYSLFHLAWLEQEVGSYTEALRIYARIMPIWVNEFGDQDPRTVSILNDYAAALSREPEMGDSALAVYQKVLQVRVDEFGPEHPLVGDVLINIGNQHLRADRPAEAKPYYLQALEIYDSTYGASGEVDRKARIWKNLGDLSEALGEYEDAENWYRQSLAGWRSAVGTGHPSYRATLESLADLMQTMGRSAEAQSLRTELESTETAGEAQAPSP